MLWTNVYVIDHVYMLWTIVYVIDHMYSICICYRPYVYVMDHMHVVIKSDLAFG